PGRQPRHSRRRHRPSRRLRLAHGRPRGLAAARRGGGRPPHPGHRPLLLPLHLLPRAERRPLRDRHDRPGLRLRRAEGDAGRSAVAPARVRTPARADRAAPDAHLQPAQARGGVRMTQVETETTKLAPETRLGAVELTVTDLDRSVSFYEDAIGLRTHGHGGGRAALGAGGEDLLVLVENPDAGPAGRHAGLYHFALLHPSRQELARAAARLARTRTPIQGASDHGISEAIYLPDPDGNGIELAADRPPERWGDLRDPTTIGPNPLDLPDLLALVEGAEPTPHADPGLKVGHVHVHVGDVERALGFWRDLIGFDVMT